MRHFAQRCPYRPHKGVPSDVLVNGDLDENQAGQKAAEKNIGPLLKAGLRVRAIDVPGDPAEFIATKGTEAYRAQVDGARPLIEWLAKHAKERVGITEEMERKGSRTGIGLIEDETERREAQRWSEDLSNRQLKASQWVEDQLVNVQGEHRIAISNEFARYLRVKEPVDADAEEHAEHISGWDFTISPAKSYSAMALVGGDQRIMEWHREAVKTALDAGEKYMQARLGGKRGAQTTENWAAALFMHDTARPVDGAAPNAHLHTHCVVFNMTLAAGIEEGDSEQVRSAKMHELFKIQDYIGQVYQNEMAVMAIEGGYELELLRNGATQIKGLSEEYLEAISARKNQIEEEKAKRGLEGKGADKIINKQLREAKQKLY